MYRRRFLRAAATAPLAAGCTGGGGGSTPTETATQTSTSTPTATQTATPAAGGSADATVRINFFQFEPQKVSIDPGGTVRWINEQGTAHTIVSATYVDEATEWQLDSGSLAQGDAVTHTFEEQGVYHYFCETHGKKQNCGVVLVGGTSFPAEKLPCNKGSVQ